MGNETKIPAAIMAADGSNPLGIARSLGRNGVPVYILSSNNAVLTKKSRFVKGGIFNIKFSKPETLKNGFSQVLQKIKQKHGQHIKPVLFVTNETHYHCLLPLLDFVKEHFIELMPVETAVPFAEKEAQFPLAEQAGFKIAATKIITSAKELTEFNSPPLGGQERSFPVIVKPRALKTAGNFHEKALIFNDFQELEKRIAPYYEPDTSETGFPELLVQEYIPGNDTQVLFFMASCGENGKVRNFITGRKLRQYPPNCGVMTAGIIEDLPDFAEKSKELCRLFGLCGFIGIECKQHPQTGELFYIESSIRVEANNTVCLSAGKNLVYDAYLAALQYPYASAASKYVFQGSWCDFFTDLDAARILIKRKQLTWRQYFKRLPLPIQYAVFTWDDPLPFLCWLPQRIFAAVRSLLKR